MRYLIQCIVNILFKGARINKQATINNRCYCFSCSRNAPLSHPLLCGLEVPSISKSDAEIGVPESIELEPIESI